MPTAEIFGLAKRFVDFALCIHRGNARTVVEGEIKTLLLCVRAAGFDVHAITPVWTKEEPSSFIVMTLQNKHHEFATGWLNCAIKFVTLGVGVEKRSREFLAEAIAREIKRSVPFVPIQLTAKGDMLCEFPPGPRPKLSGSRYFVDHTREDSALTACVGVHMNCWGWMDRILEDAESDAIVCRGCDLRISIPNTLRNFGDLREYLSSHR